MTNVAIYNLIGIKVDSSYPWVNTLSITKWANNVNEEEYDNCKAHIEIKKVNALHTDDCRDIGSGMFIKHNGFIDMEYGVRLDRIDSSNIILTVTQECNEWLNISLQLLLITLDCTLIHAAALEKNGKVLMLPSWGGVGKTATVVRMVKEEGWKLLGDDLVILHKGEILPYLKPFVIYPYHRPLFPEVFSENKGKIVSNLKLSSFMGTIIPSVKRVLRPVPKLLAFARKHNPQSMRINPKQIFSKDQLSTGGLLERVVWLERTTNKITSFDEKSAEEMASKTVSVTMMEIFSDRLRCILALNGAGVFDYKDTQLKMYNLIKSAYNNVSCNEINIPTSVPIKEVGNVVNKYVNPENESLNETENI